MPRKKTIPTEPMSDPHVEVTESTVETTPDLMEQPPPDIPAGSAPSGEDLEISSVPSETDAEAEVVPTEASEDAEESSSDDADTGGGLRCCGAGAFALPTGGRTSE